MQHLPIFTTPLRRSRLSNTITLLALVAVLMTVPFTLVKAQGLWHHAITANVPDNFPNAIATDHEGNVVVAGMTFVAGSASSYEVTVAKFDPAGDLLWRRSHTGVVFTSVGLFTVVDSHDNIYAIGSDFNNGPLITEYGPDGAFQAQAYVLHDVIGQFGTGYVLGAVISPSDGIYLTGSSPAMHNSGYVAKIRPGLQMEWAVPFANGAQIYDPSQPIALDPAGNVVVAADIVSTTPSFTAYATFAKYDPNGVLLATGAVDRSAGVSFSYVKDVAADRDGNIYLTGWYGYNPPSKYPMMTAKFSSAGALEWRKGYSGDAPAGAVGQKIVIDSRNDIIVGGYTYISQDLYPDAIQTVVKYDSEGDQLWDNRTGYHNTPDFNLVSLFLDSHDDIVTFSGAATTTTGTPFQTAMTARFDPLGSLLQQERYDGTPSNPDLVIPKAAALDPLSSATYTVSWVKVGNVGSWMVIKY